MCLGPYTVSISLATVTPSCGRLRDFVVVVLVQWATDWSAVSLGSVRRIATLLMQAILRGLG